MDSVGIGLAIGLPALGAVLGVFTYLRSFQHDQSEEAKECFEERRQWNLERRELQAEIDARGARVRMLERQVFELMLDDIRGAQ